MAESVKDQFFVLSKSTQLEVNEQRLLLNHVDITDLLVKDNSDISLKALEKSREIYQEWIGQQPNQNIVFLSGAGTSYGVGKGNIKGKTLKGLWDGLIAEYKDVMIGLIAKASYPQDGTDLEALLTRAYRTYELSKDGDLKTMINTVEKFITEQCSLEFEAVSTSAHSILLNKITKRKVGQARVKIFTLNYDTLFEQAASDQRFTIIDGFSFSNPKCFYGHSYDHDIVLRTGSRLKNEDNFIKKVFHLYKMHGSVDWLDDGKEIFQFPKELIQQKLEADENLKRVLIYPRDSKFELSYEQPYFEIIGRLQQALRAENTFLITAGFSFCDKHIRSIILEALKQNPSLHLLAVTYPEIVADKELRSFALIDNRIMLINETFTDFANTYPDNQSFSNEDPLEMIVSELARKLKGSKE
ncbi:MAG: SIR2 family protein [Bacteroidota bacterium]